MAPKKSSPAHAIDRELDEVTRAIDALTFDAQRWEPRGAKKRPPQIRRILACVDSSRASEHVSAWTLAVARATGARVHAASVIAPATYYKHYEVHTGGRWRAADARTADLASARAALDRIKTSCASAGVAFDSRVVEGFAGHELPRLARSLKADLVVVGSHGHGPLERLLLGSVADTVKNHAACSVLIAKGAPELARILVAVDGSTPSKAAAKTGLLLAGKWGSDVRIVHGFQMAVFTHPDDAVQEFRDVLAKTQIPLGGKKLQYRLVLHRPAEAILMEASDVGAGLIVLGSRGLGALRGALMGSTSNAVSHRAKASVLLVR